MAWILICKDELYERIRDLEEIIEEKDYEIEELKKQLAKEEEIRKEFYRPIGLYEFYGISEKEFC